MAATGTSLERGMNSRARAARGQCAIAFSQREITPVSDPLNAAGRSNPGETVPGPCLRSRNLSGSERICVEQSGSSEPSPESPILKIKGNIEITNSREWANTPGGQIFQSAGRARPEGLRSRAVRQKIKLRQFFPPPTFFWVAQPSAIQENLRSCRGRRPCHLGILVSSQQGNVCHISCQCGVLTIVGSFCGG